MAAEPTHYYFDEFCLDTVRGVLSRGESSILDLRPKSFALLFLCSSRTRNKLHSREDLLQQLWPDVVVTDDSLTQCVSDLRRAFGERAPQVLKTVPRRGYILIAKVKAESADKSSAPQSAPQVSGSTSPSVCLALDAVAPLTTDAADLAKTLTADLMMELTKFEMARIAGTHGPATATYHIPRGELRVAKGKLRIDARLEDLASGASLYGPKHSRNP